MKQAGHRNSIYKYASNFHSHQNTEILKQYFNKNYGGTRNTDTYSKRNSKPKENHTIQPLNLFR